MWPELTSSGGLSKVGLFFVIHLAGTSGIRGLRRGLGRSVQTLRWTEGRKLAVVLWLSGFLFG